MTTANRITKTLALTAFGLCLAAPLMAWIMSKAVGRPFTSWTSIPLALILIVVPQFYIGSVLSLRARMFGVGDDEEAIDLPFSRSAKRTMLIFAGLGLVAFVVSMVMLSSSVDRSWALVPATIIVLLVTQWGNVAKIMGFREADRRDAEQAGTPEKTPTRIQLLTGLLPPFLVFMAAAIAFVSGWFYLLFAERTTIAVILFAIVLPLLWLGRKLVSRFVFRWSLAS